MSSDINVAKELDCKEMLCPMPIYKASLAMGQLSAGDVLKVVCTDPGSVQDFPAFAKQGGHELIASESDAKLYTFFLRKGRA